MIMSQSKGKIKDVGQLMPFDHTILKVKWGKMFTLNKIKIRIKILNKLVDRLKLANEKDKFNLDKKKMQLLNISISSIRFKEEGTINVTISNVIWKKKSKIYKIANYVKFHLYYIQIRNEKNKLNKNVNKNSSKNNYIWKKE